MLVHSPLLEETHTPCLKVHMEDEMKGRQDLNGGKLTICSIAVDLIRIIRRKGMKYMKTLVLPVVHPPHLGTLDYPTLESGISRTPQLRPAGSGAPKRTPLALPMTAEHAGLFAPCPLKGRRAG